MHAIYLCLYMHVSWLEIFNMKKNNLKYWELFYLEYKDWDRARARAWAYDPWVCVSTFIYVLEWMNNEWVNNLWI